MITIIAWYFIVNFIIVLIQIFCGQYNKHMTWGDMIYMFLVALPHYISVLVLFLPISLYIYYTIIKHDKMVADFNKSMGFRFEDKELTLKQRYFNELHLGGFFMKYPNLSGNWYFDKEQYERIKRSER